MQFLYVHTHPVERCLQGKPDEARPLLARLQEGLDAAGVTMAGLWAAPHEHTLYAILEADDLAALERALTPLTTWGTARLIPVTSVRQ